MALILSKFIPVFLLPLGLFLVILAVCAVCLWWSDIRRRTLAFLILACLLALWTAGSPCFSDWLLTTLEGRYHSREVAAYPRAHAIVVLGGGVAVQRTGERNVLPGPAFDRLYLGRLLYQAGKAPKMVLSGGGIQWQRKAGAVFESRLMAALLRQMGLPEQAFIKESFSRNTRENAWYVREILPDAKTVLLVTSAFHMTRARSCFERLGMTVDSCPADFRVDPYKKRTALDFLPDAAALENTTIALREYLGMVYYRLRGWI